MNTLQKALNNLIAWTITSSNDPADVSLTIKGALLLTVPWIMSVVGFEHWSLGQDQITAVFDAVAAFIQGFLAVVAYAITLYGAVRKVIYTIFPPKSA